MAKAMSIFGMIVSALLLLAFVADLAIGVPFGGVNTMMDIGFAVGSALLAYMSFDAFRASS